MQDKFYLKIITEENVIHIPLMKTTEKDHDKLIKSLWKQVTCEFKYFKIENGIYHIENLQRITIYKAKEKHND